MAKLPLHHPDRVLDLGAQLSLERHWSERQWRRDDPVDARVERGGVRLLTSTSVPERSVMPLSARCALTSAKIARVSLCRIQGRDRWALECLIHAGAKGCTPIDHPGPRWSAYVHDLRHEHGLDIETISEDYGPPFDGTHARYVLRSAVSRDDEAGA